MLLSWLGGNMKPFFVVAAGIKSRRELELLGRGGRRAS